MSCDRAFVGQAIRFLFRHYDGANELDISSATEMKASFRYAPSPDACESFSRDGAFYTDGTDGIWHYDTVEGDLSKAGEWKVQGHVKVGGKLYVSSIHTITVERMLV